jgi:hypothetical protein
MTSFEELTKRTDRGFFKKSLELGAKIAAKHPVSDASSVSRSQM